MPKKVGAWNKNKGWTTISNKYIVDVGALSRNSERVGARSGKVKKGRSVECLLPLPHPPSSQRDSIIPKLGQMRISLTFLEISEKSGSVTFPKIVFFLPIDLPFCRCLCLFWIQEQLHKGIYMTIPFKASKSSQESLHPGRVTCWTLKFSPGNNFDHFPLGNQRNTRGGPGVKIAPRSDPF